MMITMMMTKVVKMRVMSFAYNEDASDDDDNCSIDQILDVCVIFLQVTK